MNEKHPLPKTANITVVHREIRDTAVRSHREMLRLESEPPAEIRFESGPASTEVLHFFETKQLSQMYSRVVQVFSLLAVEAFLNEYGYLRFSREVFEKKYDRLPLHKKLASMLGDAVGNFDPESEIAALAKTLAERRNRLVHPKPELEVWNDDCSKSQTTKRLPRVDAEPATAALEEMD